MKSKAQLTIFALIGLVMLVIAGLLFIAIPGFDLDKYGSDAAKDYADACFEKTGTCLLQRLGASGGNLQSSTELPTLEQIQQNSKDYFTKTAALCQNNFQDFPAQVTAGPISPKILLNFGDTIIKTTQKITVTRGKTTKTFDKFSSRLPIRFRATHQLAASLKQHSLTSINESYINSNLLETNEFDANIYEGDNIVVILTDRKSNIKAVGYKFAFIK